VYPSMVHMRTASSVAMQDGGSGMEHLQAYRAAVGGKPHANRASHAAARFAIARRLIFAVATLFAAAVFSSASHAQSGPFAGLAGNWSGGGNVTLDDGSTERIRCRASYAVGNGGSGLNQTLTCASDSYKFNLSTNVIAQGSSLSGTWSEGSRNINGALEGRGGNGNFEVVATAPGFTANISLTTRGNKQSVVIRAESQFRGDTRT
jgi:hypothetical protein